jgi:hypothetical protein
MNEQQQSLETLKDIRSIMERSSRFISLSGWSGVAAGVCALAGAFFARQYLGFSGSSSRLEGVIVYPAPQGASVVDWLINDKLFQIALITFVAAFLSAFVFTYFKTKKQGAKLWDATSTRLLVNVAIPMIVGGFFIFRLIELAMYGLIAPACLIFYGLALLNASKYTFKEIRWLGLMQIVLGLFNLWNIGNGLIYWSIGFGVLHIVYGVVMWYKYERV